MTENQAVEILNSQLEKLKTVNPDTANSWKANTKSYIITFFGEDSPENEFISSLKMLSISSYESDLEAVKRHKASATDFVNNCIETIKNKGIYKPPKPNFLLHLDGKVVISVILAAFAGLYFLGYAIGKNSADLNNINLREKVEELEDSLRTFSVSLTLDVADTVAHVSADTNKNQNKDKDSVQ